jgi:spore maturation protein CgeB
MPSQASSGGIRVCFAVRIARNQDDVLASADRMLPTVDRPDLDRSDARGADPELLIVGLAGGTHIGASFARAARRLDLRWRLFDTTEAYKGARAAQLIAWHLCRRPLRLNRFAREIVAYCARPACAPRVLIATGAAPLTATALLRLRSAGVFCINYSTDDPWNQSQRASWHLRALSHYDAVITPRRANLQDFYAAGCLDVRYLPFAYDDELFGPAPIPTGALASGVLFVGGADKDRAAFMARFMRSGLRPALVGGYWDRFPETRGCSLGLRDSEGLRALTAAAAVNLCLVRRANRDGHVMRSFEIPAIGGFMLAEDTVEHREIFGEEGRCVLYFNTPEAAVEKARWALAQPNERDRMARAAHELVIGGKHTYRDRLLQMLATANE